MKRMDDLYKKLRNFIGSLHYFKPGSKEDKMEIFEKELVRLRDSKDDLSHIASGAIEDDLDYVEKRYGPEFRKSFENLNELDYMYGVANSLSVENVGYFNTILKLITVCGGVLTFSFVFYDEWDLFFLMFVCFAMIICLIAIHWWSNNSQCHENYLEFRVLAESFRVQFFLSIAGMEEDVVSLLPWFVKRGPVWISDVLRQLPEISLPEKKPILDFWIRNQLSYNESALQRKTKQMNNRDFWAKTAIIFTFIAYAVATLFEIYVLFNSGAGFNVMESRIGIKVVLGVLSVVTLCAESYYGKKALDDVVDDHRRMVELYQDAEKRIIQEEESEEVVLYLAREFLIENSTWYAYQKQNKPNLVL